MKLSHFLLGPLLLLVLALSPLGYSADADEEDWQVPVTVGKNGWMIYTNARFGFALPVPPAMKAQRPPDNGDGMEFNSLDGKVKLIGYGSFNIDGIGDVEARWNSALEEPNRTITYKRKTEGWYVVSGVTKEGVGFYERYTANSKYCAGWSIAYPQAEEAKYAKWVERIAKGYDPRLGKGDDTVQ